MDYINRIFCGDSLHMPEIPDESVDALVTDPPAGISFMNLEFDHDKGGREQWIMWLRDVMREAHRVMKPGAHGLVWSIPRTSHWTATALEDAGFEIRDCVSHLYSTGFPKSQDVSKMIDKMAGAEREVIGVKPGHETTAGRDNLVSFREGALAGEEGVSRGYSRPWMHDQEKVLASHMETAPATDDAKKWSGWATAMKPAQESWLLIRKPLTVVPLDEKLAEACGDLGEMLCRFLFDVKFVVSNSSSSRTVQNAACDSVQWLAGVLNGLVLLEESEKMDTCKLPEAASTIWSIVFSWRNILDVSCSRQNTYTMKTETALIIELKILRFLISPLIAQNIIQAEMNQNGEMSSVGVVGRLLDAIAEKSRCILTLIAPERACMQADSKPAYLEELLPDANETSLGDYSSENWIMIRKPLSEKTIVANVLKHGTGALNVEESRIAYAAEDDVPTQDQWNKIGSSGNAGANGYAGQFSAGMKKAYADGKIPVPTGRWPANVVFSHDPACSETLCADECAVAELNRQGGFSKTRHEPPTNNGHGDGHEGWQQGTFQTNRGERGYTDEGFPSRFFKTFRPGDDMEIAGPRFRYIAKPSISEKNANIGDDIPEGDSIGKLAYGTLSSPNLARPQNRLPARNNHPTVKPLALMQYLIRLICPPGGVVLDNFSGSGTTLIAADSMGFRWVGYEKNPEYVKIIEARLSQRSLFSV